MTINGTDERQLPAMYMIWPIHRLSHPPVAVVESGYVGRACHDQDLPALRTLIDADGPISDHAWEDFRDRIIPGGAFLVTHTASGQPVATASAVHNPRATRYYFPFGGEVGYVTVDAAHRRRGIGRAVVALVVARLLAGHYRQIFVGVQGWRLPAIKCYLSLGFVPLLHTEELLPRWLRICGHIGWAVNVAEWPQTVAAATGSAAESGPPADRPRA